MKNTSLLGKFIWLLVTAILALLFSKLFFQNATYPQVFMFTHISVTIIISQLVLGIIAFVSKRDEPFVDLLNFLIFSVVSFLFTILVSAIISAIADIPLSYSYIIVVILYQFLPNYQRKEKTNND